MFRPRFPFLSHDPHCSAEMPSSLVSACCHSFLACRRHYFISTCRSRSFPLSVANPALPFSSSFVSSFQSSRPLLLPLSLLLPLCFLFPILLYPSFLRFLNSFLFLVFLPLSLSLPYFLSFLLPFFVPPLLLPLSLSSSRLYPSLCLFLPPSLSSSNSHAVIFPSLSVFFLPLPSLSFPPTQTYLTFFSF